ncbi:hypothetical protein SAY87_016005 [Trapa incisa]|uniref:DNL-type domain-containing protein n=1 Tax=Trapa incisa TaxID=236973 RepID=A0AAN7QU26_9MYRT|nr:hypothetical protein SAY87_016005 [Trapa incisa]
MAAMTSYRSFPVAPFSLLPQAAAQRRSNSCFSTKGNVRVCRLISAPTSHSFQRSLSFLVLRSFPQSAFHICPHYLDYVFIGRFGYFPTSVGQEKWRHRRLAVCASLEGSENESDHEAAINSNPDSGATVDLKLPRRRLLVQFTCNECGERTSRLVNRLAYERGLVYVECAGCLRHHKLVDNLGLVMEFDLREETNSKSDAD